MIAFSPSLQFEMNSPEGEQFRSFYPDCDSFPALVVIEARTGELLAQFSGQMSLEEVSENCACDRYFNEEEWFLLFELTHDCLILFFSGHIFGQQRN
jgi:hypothetical protein